MARKVRPITDLPGDLLVKVEKAVAESASHMIFGLQSAGPWWTGHFAQSWLYHQVQFSLQILQDLKRTEINSYLVNSMIDQITMLWIVVLLLVVKPEYMEEKEKHLWHG